jgi:hypothetical protein
MSSDFLPQELSRAEKARLLHDAPKVFSRVFAQLLLWCSLSQKDLAVRATAIRDSMVAKGEISKRDSVIGSQAQPTISNVMDGQQRPTHGQLLLWLEVVRDWCNDNPDMLAKIARLGVHKPDYPSAIEDDLYRLALFGTISEISGAYEYWKDLHLFDYFELAKEAKTRQGVRNTDVNYRLPSPQDTDEIACYPSSDQIHGGIEKVRRALRRPELQH